MIERDTLRLRVEDGVGVITLSRPDKQNAITGTLVGDLGYALDEVEKSEARVVVLEAEGPAFCTGADLRDFLAQRERLVERAPGVEASAWMAMMADLSGLIVRLRRFRYPVIAAVNGSAMGGGANIALACDMRIASDDARFASSFVKVGLGSAAMGGTYLWPRIVGFGRALEALLTGRVIEAEEADRIGLVNRVVPADELTSEVMSLAHQLAQLPPLGLEATKRGLNMGVDAPLEQAVAYESAQQVPLFMTDDHHEGMRAFVDKRAPAFKGQ